MAGDRGGSWLNPFDNISYYAGRASQAANSALTPGLYSGGNIRGGGGAPATTNPSTALGNGGFTAVLGANTSNKTGANDPKPTEIVDNTGYDTNSNIYSDGRNSNGYYGDYTSADVANLEGTLSRTDRLLQSLGVNRDVGLSNIKNSYDKTVGRAQNDQSLANKGLNTRASDNDAAKLDAFNKINNTAENRYRSAMQTLGVHGAGVSSAAQRVMPYMVSKQATADRGDQVNTYQRNARDIATAQNKSDLDYKRLFEDLLGNYQKDEQGLRQSYLNQENDLYGQRAQVASQLDYARGGTGQQAYADLNGRLTNNQNSLDELVRRYATPAYNYQAIDSTAPTLSQFGTDTQAINGSQMATDPTATDVNAYLPWILRDEKLGLLG